MKFLYLHMKLAMSKVQLNLVKGQILFSPCCMLKIRQFFAVSQIECIVNLKGMTMFSEVQDVQCNSMLVL